jgi:hypothetical protein
LNPGPGGSAFEIAVLDEMGQGVDARLTNIGIVENIPSHVEQFGLLDEGA